MPTVAELQRLEALAGRLTPLTDVLPGELIRAADWNTVVGALIEVARAVLAEEREGAVPPHTHPDQVTAGWLDPNLRAIIERGPLSDPAAQGRLGNLERQLGRATTRLEEIAGGVKEARDRVTEVATRDLKREADVTNVRRVIEGLGDARNDVLDLRESLRSIQADVKIAVDLSSRLVVNDQPVDMNVIDQRLRGVEELRDRMRRPDGTLLDATTFELRLAEVTNKAVTQEQFDEGLRTRAGVIPAEVLTQLEGRVRTNVLSDVQSTVSQLGNDIRSDMSERFAAVDNLVGRAVSDALPGVKTSVLDGARQLISTAVAKALEDSRAAFEGRLEEVGSVLRQEFKSQIGEVSAAIPATVRIEFEKQLPAALNPLRTQLDTLAARVEPLSGRITTLDGALTQLATRIEVISRDNLTAVSDLRTNLIAEMDRRDRVRVTDLDTRFAANDTVMSQRIDLALATQRRGLVEDVNRAATDAAGTEVSSAETRLRGDMRTVAREETVSLQDQMSGLVSQQVQEAMAGVPGLVSREVRLATANMPQLVRNEFTAFQPQLNQMVDTSVRARINR